MVTANTTWVKAEWPFHRYPDIFWDLEFPRYLENFKVFRKNLRIFIYIQFANVQSTLEKGLKCAYTLPEGENFTFDVLIKNVRFGLKMYISLSLFSLSPRHVDNVADRIWKCYKHPRLSPVE